MRKISNKRYKELIDIESNHLEEFDKSKLKLVENFNLSTCRAYAIARQSNDYLQDDIKKLEKENKILRDKKTKSILYYIE